MNAALRAAATAALLALALLPARVCRVEARPARPFESQETVVVRKWLALDAVDTRGRHPFNPNAPFLRYLLDRGAPPPKAGETVKGDRGEAAWREVAAKEDGTVEDSNGAWFYAAVESPAERVHLSHLDGAGAIFVNGAGFVGDVYRGGYGPVPVALRKGVNHLFVAGPRGPWRLRLETWVEGRSPILPEDATLPDVQEGARDFAGPVSFRIVNPSLGWQAVGAAVEPAPPPPDEDRGRRAVPPLWAGKATDSVTFSRGVGRKGPVSFGVEPWTESGTRRQVPSVTFTLEMRRPEEPRRVTFCSGIDGSVQYYAVLPPAKSDLAAEKVSTVLALHGASVDAVGLPGCYAPKPDFRIVAPTNRRPFGFDWQDWGRRDAYEVLDHALKTFGGDPSRVFLTGHSMGGHGVWHLAANDPDRWAAIAPSAGWCSFDTYGGGPRPETPLSAIWRSCDGGSRTEDLIPNLVPIPTFVLHGTKDDNVPLSEAAGMIERLEKAGGKPLRHFEEGAGHWWDGEASPGVDCVDWPGIFEMFRRPGDRWDPDNLHFVTVDPAVDSRHGWFEVLQPLSYGTPVEVTATWLANEDSLVLRAKNLRAFRLPRCPSKLLVLEPGPHSPPIPSPAGQADVVFRKTDGEWAFEAGTKPSEKSPERSGPFKRVFDNRFVLVVGTKGTGEENREMLELARFHAGVWWYRANGSAPVVRDTDVLASREVYAGRNLILYGNADVNAAWGAVVPAACPLAVRRGEIRLDVAAWKGDGLGAVLVYPRADDPAALVGAFASTGPRGTRVAYGLLPFVSGVGYPDWAVFGEEFLRSGDGGVLAAGWFDHRWALQPGAFVREPTRKEGGR